MVVMAMAAAVVAAAAAAAAAAAMPLMIAVLRQGTARWHHPRTAPWAVVGTVRMCAPCEKSTHRIAGRSTLAHQCTNRRSMSRGLGLMVQVAGEVAKAAMAAA